MNLRVLHGLACVLVLAPATAGVLDAPGRAETRVRSAPYPLAAGRTVEETALPERLARLGYERVHDRPTVPGTWFWGHDVVWVYRRAHRLDGRDLPASRIGLAVDRATGRIVGAVDGRGEPRPFRAGDLWLEPETLAESLAADRARKIPIDLDALPEHVWRSVLAAEDHRFFDHVGVSGIALARAALANVESGGIAQGGSTITQQLVKNRDLTPKRSLGRKVSEAVRALALEAEVSKETILETYLETVYWGHVEGVSVYGIGAAARAWFSTDVERLSLPQAAALAAMIQGPNGLAPDRHEARLRARRDRILDRMAELGWAEPDDVARAKAAAVDARPRRPDPEGPRAFLSWLSSSIDGPSASRLERGRGIVVQTTLDPVLQQVAEEAVRNGLARLRADDARLRSGPLSAALVALDPETGDVLAYVGGDPDASRDRFDRARSASRQPGSTVKPFVLLEAFSGCGTSGALAPSTRVADEPIRLALPSGTWEPKNFDGRYRGPIEVREALAGSRNVPVVRVARHCGFDRVADRFREVGLDVPDDPPPSFVLGAVETSPLALARAYTALAAPGRVVEPRPFVRIERPAGRRLGSERIVRHRVAPPAAAWLVRDVLRTAATSGTAALAGGVAEDVAAKTGSSSDLRDAWFAGHAGGVVTVVWVGLDDGTLLGRTGAAAAGPIWREFMSAAVPARPPRPMPEPSGVVHGWVQPSTGLRVGEHRDDAVPAVFRRGALPPHRRIWRRDRPLPVVR